MSKLKPEILRDIQWNAEAQRGGGASVTIDYNLPTIAVELRNGDTFFFQGDEASGLLSEAMIDQTDVYIAPEDMILWLAQGW